MEINAEQIQSISDLGAESLKLERENMRLREQRDALAEASKIALSRLSWAERGLRAALATLENDEGN